MPIKECPLCGGSMQMKETQTAVRVPGNQSATTRTVQEWVCPDCDYFEEVGEDDD